MDNKKEQFSLIYDQYIEKIYRFVYVKVNSKDIAQDITSKVFVNGWESYEKGSGGIKNIKAFLYQIARNMVIDYYREKDKKATVSVDHIAQFADGRTGLHDKAMLTSDMEGVTMAIQNLKKDYQDVLI